MYYANIRNVLSLLVVLLKAISLIQADYFHSFYLLLKLSLSGNSCFLFFVQLETVMLLISGALVNGPYALITTAVSADLVSLASPLFPPLQL